MASHGLRRERKDSREVWVCAKAQAGGQVREPFGLAGGEGNAGE